MRLALSSATMLQVYVTAGVCWMPVRYVSRIGAKSRKTISGLGHFFRFCGRVLRGSVRPPWRTRMILAHAYTLGVRGMPVAMLTALFVGMVIVLQGGNQLAAFNAKQFT